MLNAAHTWKLAVIAAISGVVLLWIWKRVSDPDRSRLARRRMRAQLYAMRLYSAEPRLILRAQGRLLVWTGRYLAANLRPAAVAALPLLILFSQLDGCFGRRALHAGEATIVTARLAAPNRGAAELKAIGAAVETPGVRLSNGREVCWRLRAGATGMGEVTLETPGVRISRAVNCGTGWHLPAGPWNGANTLQIACPAATLGVFGIAVGWPVWFLLVSCATMFALRARFGVVL